MALDEADTSAAPAGDADAEALRAARRARLRSAAAVALHWAGVLLVVVIGSSIGAVLAPSTPAKVGPLLLDVRVVPSLRPGVQLLLPPAGRVDFDTHLAPVAVQARVREVDLEAAKRLFGDPRGLAGLSAAAPERLRAATLRAALTTGVCALLGACSLSLVVYRRVWRRTVQVAAGLVGVLVATGLTAVATFDADQLAQPHFTGLLSRAPYVAGQAGGLLDRLESYRSGLADIVRGVTALYATSDELPVLPDTADGDVVRVLHVSDIHLNPLAFDLIDRLVPQFKIDMVVDTGDITTWGTEVESGTLSRIGALDVPYVFVRGNHDSRRTQAAVAANRNAIVLDGDVRTVKGVVLAGIGDPRFTPDEGAGPTPSGPATSGAATTAGPTPADPEPTDGLAGGTPAAGRTQGESGSGTSTPDAGEARPAADPRVRVGERLADTIRAWDARHPDDRVELALVHEPASTTPLLGTVPTVLAGHLHKRDTRVDATGTRVMVQGSTGGAGITAGTVDRLAERNPVPLMATILYVARSGVRRGQVVAYDDVTVGGFGIASVSLERTVVRPGDVPVVPSPGATPTTDGATSAGASGAGAGAGAGAGPGTTGPASRGSPSG